VEEERLPSAVAARAVDVDYMADVSLQIGPELPRYRGTEE
jgi:hypothetical protein